MIRWLTLPIACISEATSQGITPSDDPSSLHRAIYVARSYLALSPPNPADASTAIKPFLSSSSSSSPAAKAVDAFIRYRSAAAGNTKEGVLDELRDLVIETEGSEEDESKVEEGFVRTLAGTVFILEGENEEAVATLTEGVAKTDIEWYVPSPLLFVAFARSRSHLNVSGGVTELMVTQATLFSSSYSSRSTGAIWRRQHTRT